MMNRIDRDGYKNGKLWNGFDYDLQCWVKAGKVEGHHDM